MRTAAMTLALFLGMSGLARAGDRETALALIGQAIKAHGGEAALTRAQTAIRTGSGALLFGAGEDAFTDEVAFGLPMRYRQSIKLEKFGQIIIVVNGNRGWRSAGGAVGDLSKEGVDELREGLYAEWLTTLLPLTKDGFDLAPVADKLVDGKPAAGVKASSKGHAEVRLYFDKGSGLLVKVERQAKDAGILVNKDCVFAAHKDFDGAKLPTRRTEFLNGKKFVELKSATYKFPAKVDNALFDRP